MSVFRHAKWLSGTGITEGDLSNISTFLRSQFLDTLGALARVGEASSVPATTYAWCIGNAGAPYAHTTGLSIRNLGGPIAQQNVAAIDGNDTKLAVYYLAAQELNTTFAAADVTNPRIDLVAIKIDDADDPMVLRHYEDAVTRAKTSALEVVTRGVRITKTVVPGTPAATPVEPAVPAGFVKWASVRIPANATDLDNLAGFHQLATGVEIYDHRMPLGIRRIDVWGKDAFFDPATWDPSGIHRKFLHNLAVGAAGPLTDALWVPTGCPIVTGRLLSVAAQAIVGGAAGAFEAYLARFDPYEGTQNSNTTDVYNVGLPLTADSILNASGIREWREAIPTVPIWMNGQYAGYANEVPGLLIGLSDAKTRLAVRVKPSAAAQINIVAISFLVAGG